MNAFKTQVKQGTLSWHIFTHFEIYQKPQESKTMNFQMHDLVG